MADDDLDAEDGKPVHKGDTITLSSGLLGGGFLEACRRTLPPPLPQCFAHALLSSCSERASVAGSGPRDERSAGPRVVVGGSVWCARRRAYP